MDVFRKPTLLLAALLSLCVVGCGDKPPNDPYPSHEEDANVLYTSFSERPKHLDPARSYSSNEWAISNQIYETPLQYHYLQRPYTLEPLLLTQMPQVSFLDKDGKPTDDPNLIATSEYLLTLKPGVQYQPHPAFARQDTAYTYLDLSVAEAEQKRTIGDFEQSGTRELVAQDMVYQIKRIASDKTHSPIYGLMSQYIIGLSELREALQAEQAVNPQQWLDLRDFDLSGVKALNQYQYQITLKGYYPQFKYWLAMQFFAPMPWEADQFYAQPGLLEHNISLDWYPVGTGAYMMIDNNPNQRILLQRNPNFHGEYYPTQGAAGDQAAGLLDRAGKPLPMIDQIHFNLEKESIPYWNKFLQGYYDLSGISNDSFDQAMQMQQGGLSLSDSLIDQGISLTTSINPSIHYWGFNMTDPIVGGDSEKQRLLRRAIAIAFDIEEYIQIFLNGRAQAAQGPIPPGIFGYEAGSHNPYVYEDKTGGVTRQSLETAKDLLAKAGYPGGIDPATNQPLNLHYDAIGGGGPDLKAQYAWVRKQFQKLGINLIVRATQYNRFQEKMRTGNAQFFSWGWNADYPDPENFFFLFYGPHAKVTSGGENAANYQNADFDRWFDEMKHTADGPSRQALISQMTTLLQQDSPWIFGVFPKAYTLKHQWLEPMKPNAMSRNTMKYQSLDAKMRSELRRQWNKPVWRPVLVLFGVLMLMCLPAYVLYRRKIHQPPCRQKLGG